MLTVESYDNRSALVMEDYENKISLIGDYKINNSIVFIPYMMMGESEPKEIRLEEASSICEFAKMNGIISSFKEARNGKVIEIKISTVTPARQDRHGHVFQLLREVEVKKIPFEAYTRAEVVRMVARWEYDFGPVRGAGKIIQMYSSISTTLKVA